MSVTFIYSVCCCCGRTIAPPIDYNPEIHTLYCSETCKVVIRVIDYMASFEEEEYEEV